MENSGTPAQVNVTLPYYMEHYEDPFDASGLKITGWNGSQWVPHESDQPVGTEDLGTVRTTQPINIYGPLALHQPDGTQGRSPELTITELSDPEPCIENYYRVHFTLDTLALVGTTFRLEISNEDGTFDPNPPVIGTVMTNDSDSIEFRLGSGYTLGANYKLRIRSDKQGVIEMNTIDITPTDKPLSAVILNGPDKICTDSPNPFYVTDGDPGYTYNWYIPNSTFTTDGDTAWVTFPSHGTRGINVTPENKCGLGPQTSKAIEVKKVLPNIGKISGPTFICPGQPATYRLPQYEDLTYVWTLSDGTIINSDADTANIVFAAAGEYEIYVAATGICNPIIPTDTLIVTVLDETLQPTAVTNMRPADGTEDLKFPFLLSWTPGENNRTYDLFVWETDSSRPDLPLVADLVNVSYNLLENSGLQYGTTYNWQLTSNAGCQIIDGPIQTFQLRKPADLAVTQIDVPATANAGQTITINWTVKNNGPGATLLDETWNDAVYLSFDTLPSFAIAAINSIWWSHLDFPVAPLLVGTRSNVSALDVGEQYQNSLDFTLPQTYSQPMYVYVVTSFKSKKTAPFQIDFSNDTAMAASPIEVITLPTPDLRVDTVVTPNTIFSGSTISVTYKVTNFGAVTPSGSQWKDAFYISKSPLFDKEMAIELKLPKENETYYPAKKATHTITNSLQPEDSYTKNVDVVIPNFESGTWYLHVVTNDDEQLYEGALVDNNVNNRPIQITLTPTPQFAISSLSIPTTDFSPTQNIQINWNVKNIGFYDNMEKYKGFYGYSTGFCEIPCPDPDSEEKCYDNRKSEKDSLSWGSSYWVDRLYLSTNPNSLDTTTAIFIGEAKQGIEGIGYSVSDDIINGNIHCVAFTGKRVHPPVPEETTHNVLRPGSDHPNSFSYSVPSDIPEGEYYLYVLTNSTNTVFTYDNTPVTQRTDKITVSYADLIVSDLSVPANLQGGTVYSIPYTITNIGPGAAFNGNRKDVLYVSDQPTFDSTAVMLKEVLHRDYIASGASLEYTITGSLPNHLSGPKYFFIQTNSEQSFIEQSFANNISQGQQSSLSTAPPVDLVVTDIDIDTLSAPGAITLSYTMANIGNNDADAYSIDSVYISCSPIFDKNTAIGVGERRGSLRIPAGESTALAANIKIPEHAYRLNTCFEKEDFSTVYYHIVANHSRTIYEAGDTLNNIYSSTPRILANQNADIIITEVNAEESGSVGRPFTLDWETQNIGPGATVGAGKTTIYGVYFSQDSVWNEEGVRALAINNTMRLNSFNPGAVVRKAASVTVPKLPTGNYYVYVVADVDSTLKNEVHRDNNVGFLRDAGGRAKKIFIEQLPLADLVADITGVPEAIPVGQPITITYRVTNIGEGEAYPLAWEDVGFLSNTFSIERPNQKYNTFAYKHKTGLAPGAFYEGEVTISLPLDFPTGNYYLLINPDNQNSVVEMDEGNNLNGFPIEVYLPEPSDLVVENITVPDTIYLGYIIDSISWHVTNQSINPASGVSKDGIYLSKNTTYDSTALLLGIRDKRITMNPLGTDTLSLRPVLEGVTEGFYNLIVRTDIKNNIPELDKENNESVSVRPVYVSVKELKLGTPLSDTMTHGGAYMLVIPDSLLGSTILLTLQSEDATSVQNELYVGGGYVPSVLQNDYKFSTEGYGNQEILLADVVDSVYYISVRSITPEKGRQNITVNATVLPFAVLKAESNRGGNIGNVTVKLTGSLFTEDMTAKLSDGTTDIQASLVYFVNSTTAYATFPLAGSAIGIYDIVLNKPDGSETVLSEGFSVVSPDNGGLYSGGGINTGMVGQGTDPGCDPGALAGLNSQLAIDLVVPEMLGDGWDFTFQIHYSNPTNMDIPTQTRVLYNDLDLPMSMTKEGVAEGKTSLYIEIKETDGPPGVIRAGGSGVITIYSTVPQGTTMREGFALGKHGLIRGVYVNFTLN